MTLFIFRLFRTVLWKDKINLGVVMGVDPGKREVDEYSHYMIRLYNVV